MRPRDVATPRLESRRRISPKRERGSHRSFTKIPRLRFGLVLCTQLGSVIEQSPARKKNPEAAGPRGAKDSSYFRGRLVGNATCTHKVAWFRLAISFFVFRESV
jgi:hypothetical protein